MPETPAGYEGAARALPPDTPPPSPEPLPETTTNPLPYLFNRCIVPPCASCGSPKPPLPPLPPEAETAAGKIRALTRRHACLRRHVRRALTRPPAASTGNRPYSLIKRFSPAPARRPSSVSCPCRQGGLVASGSGVASDLVRPPPPSEMPDRTGSGVPFIRSGAPWPDCMATINFRERNRQRSSSSPGLRHQTLTLQYQKLRLRIDCGNMLNRQRESSGVTFPLQCGGMCRHDPDRPPWMVRNRCDKIPIFRA